MAIVRGLANLKSRCCFRVVSVHELAMHVRPCSQQHLAYDNKSDVFELYEF